LADRNSLVVNNGTTDSRIMACISPGTPGKAINHAPFQCRAKPGADPTGLGKTSARDGILACRN
jgi:hypothetical protein